MMNDIRYLIIDTETSGLDPSKHSMLELAARCERGVDDSDGTEFSVMFRQTPQQWARRDPRAIYVNQFTFEELENDGLEYQDACSKFLNWLMEHDIHGGNIAWVGQNPEFDARFVAATMKMYVQFVDLLHPVEAINVMDLARRLRRVDPTFQPVALSGASISLALGLQPEDHIHRAMGGVYAARQNLYALLRRLAQFELTKEKE